MQTRRNFINLPILLLGSFLLIHGILSTGCLHKPIHVRVTDEDMRRANEAMMEGDLAFNRKEYYTALLKYLEGTRRNPNNENIFNRLGITYAQLKFYESANKALQQAINLSPKFSYAWNNLGSVFFLDKKLKKAEKHFKKAIQLNKNEASFYVNLGNLYLERKRPQEALVQWQKALALDRLALTKSSAVNLSALGRTSPMERSYLMARLYASQKNVELAIENLQLAFENGFSDINAIKEDADFDPIRRDPSFEKFLKDLTLKVQLRDEVQK